MYDFLDVTSEVINDLLTGASIETEDKYISINRKRNPGKWNKYFEVTEMLHTGEFCQLNCFCCQ